MKIERQPLEKIAEDLLNLKIDELVELVSRRFWRVPASPLPPIARGEDPADVLVDIYQWIRSRGKEFENLSKACVKVVEQWSRFIKEHVQVNPEPIGEACYFCARIGATAAIPAIAKVAEREELCTVVLPGGEDLQNRALRSLAGLLAMEKIMREKYRPLFEKALDSEYHANIALPALCVFWPKERSKFIAIARKHKNENLEWVIENLPKIEEAWPTI